MWRFGKTDSSPEAPVATGIQEQRIQKNSLDVSDQIAVVGMSMRLPGGIKTTEDFWDLLIRGKDCHGPVPPSRYNADNYYCESGRPGTLPTKHGYFLDDDISTFDASFFSINGTEAATLDPKLRFLLEVVWECLENGGQVDCQGKDIGCFVGNFGDDWSEILRKDTQSIGKYHAVGGHNFSLANRVSYEYDFHGPSMTFDTACASSLMALHQACQALRNNECSGAIVGGTSMIICPSCTVSMGVAGALCGDGRCKTFDASANGYGRAEAINSIFVKRLSDAIRDGDPIRATIRSTATNCDGKTSVFIAPNPKAHEDMIKRAYSSGGIDNMGETGFYECHGTGTQLGDRCELSAVANLFQDSGVYIGSAKANVGHSEGASGLTGLIKAILSMEHETIPPHANFLTPNPNIPFDSNNLWIPTKPTPWPRERLKRASVSSFGIGGSNVHAILEGHKRLKIPAPEKSGLPKLIVHSAQSCPALKKRVKIMQSFISDHPDDLSDIAYTLCQRRERLRHRAFTIHGAGAVEKHPQLVKAPERRPPLNFIFTGQGAQWRGMGHGLMQLEPFRAEIVRMSEALKSIPNGPSWDLIDLIESQDLEFPINDPEYAQTLCTALQVGIIKVLSSWQIKPDTVLGHSSGEIAAAYAVGAISSSDTIKIAYYRGFSAKAYPHNGAMAAVSISKETAEKYLQPSVVVACQNAPKSITLSGDADELRLVLDRIKWDFPDIRLKVLNIPIAYHSHFLDEAGEFYQNLLGDSVSASQTPVGVFYSTSKTGVQTCADDFGPSYWQNNLTSPVQFHSAVSNVLRTQEDHERTIFLEIGPHSALSSPLREICASQDKGPQAIYIPTVARDESPMIGLFEAAGCLYQQSVDVDFLAINGSGTVLTDLPLYPWDHDQKYWNESRMSREWRQPKFRHHEILGSRVVESTDSNPSWRNLLSTSSAGWITDHQLRSKIIFPGAGYVCMAGEAIRQISGSADYTIRHMNLLEALVLPEESDIEVVTSLAIVPLTDAENSNKYRFTISSTTGECWINHCTGEVQGGSDYDLSDKRQLLIDKDSDRWNRTLESNKFYSALKDIGHGFGPYFRLLSSIQASSGHHAAKGTVQMDHELYRTSYYAQHPLIIDHCLQLSIVAAIKGLCYRLDHLVVPASVDQIYVAPSQHEDTSYDLKAFATKVKKSAVCQSVAGNNGEMQIAISGCSMMPLTNEIKPIEIQELHWHPMHTSMVPSELIKAPHKPAHQEILMEEIAVLCTLESDRIAGSQKPTTRHIQKYKEWLASQAHILRTQGSELVPQARRWATEDSPNWLDMIEKRAALAETKLKPWQHQLILHVFDNSLAILSEDKDPLEVLFDGTRLREFYEGLLTPSDCSPFLSSLGHEQPGLKVLEVGGGTGGFTTHVLESLKGASKVPLYSKYMFTDISAGFFPSAQKHLQSFAGIEYQVLDISSDPTAQGFPEEEYDLIVAAGVLHATPFLSKTLENVHRLLKPGGKLLNAEIFPEGIHMSYIMGIIPGWWIGDQDNRPNQPYVSSSRWNRELKATGFTGTDIVVLDQEYPFQKTGILISTKKQEKKPPEDVTLLCHHESSPVVQKIKNAFSKAGHRVQLCAYGSHKESQGGIISLLETEEPFFSAMTVNKWRTFQTLLTDIDQCGIFWVTKETQIQCHDPNYALTLGVARTVRSELAVEMATFEAQSFDNEFTDALLMAYGKFRERHGETDNREYEYLYRDGKIHVPRFQSVVAENEICAKSLQSMDARMLSIGAPGSLSSLFWKPVACRPPRDGQVMIDIQYTGLNFRDLLQALGAFGEDVEFGIEAAGTVSQACPRAGFDVGQRVVVMAPQGLLATRTVVASKNCVPIPNRISLEQAAALSCVYSTVIFALMHHGNLRKGQTILIHSACGGVGLAAISLSIMQGADIYATVGSEAKAEYLNERFGIPRNKIFSSRDSSFHSGLMRATNGKGVDIVLNSLAGELLHASWECVAKFGKMIEIGKRDIMGNGSLRLAPFLHNRSFICVSMDEIITEQPELNHQLISDAFRYIEEELIEPIEPIRKFPASQVEEAFRHMQGGQHIGKVLVQMPASLGDLPQATKSDPPKFSSEAAYMLTGGLGGIGRSVCRWMVDNGARELVCLSRSPPSSSSDFVSEIEAQGCQLTLVKGNVAIEDEVRVAIQSCKKPLKGVLHLAMVLRDRPITEMSYDEWSAPQEPKVSGAWSLHRALQGIDLDFFTLFSSTSGIAGQLGQASYSAGNTFLDAFVRYRHSMDLPAAVIDLGIVGNIGLFVDAEYRKLLETTLRGFTIIGEKEIFRAIEVAMMRQKPDSLSDQYSSHGQFAIGLTPPTKENPHHTHSLLQGDMRMGLLKPALTRAQPVRNEASRVQKLFTAMSEDSAFSERDEALTLIQDEVLHRLSCLSGSNEQDIGLRQPFSQLGLDSLVVVELRIWIQRTFHITATVSEIMSTGHVEGLTQLILSRLRER